MRISFGTCDSGRMAQTVCVIVSGSDKAWLEAIISGRNRPQKRVERAQVQPLKFADERERSGKDSRDPMRVE